LESTQTDHYIVFIHSYVNSNHNYAIVSCMWITCTAVCIGVSPAHCPSSVQQWRFFCQLASNQRSRDIRFE